MIPIKCDSHPHYVPVITAVLILGAVSAFGYQLLMPGAVRGFVPLDFVHALLHPGDKTIEMLRLCFISFFLHGGFFHLASNMWYLWIFGNAVEYRLSGLRFLCCYFIFGSVSLVVQAFSDPYSQVPIVGASGAIAGVMGMHLVMLPLARIIVWVPPIFILPIPAFIFLIVWFAVQYRGAGDLSAGHIAWWAHIGGFLTGVLTAAWLRYKKRISKK